MSDKIQLRKLYYFKNMENILMNKVEFIMKITKKQYEKNRKFILRNIIDKIETKF